MLESRISRLETTCSMVSTSQSSAPGNSQEERHSAASLSHLILAPAYLPDWEEAVSMGWAEWAPRFPQVAGWQ